MINFEYQNPTKVLFGAGKLESLSNEVLKYGDKVMLVHSGGAALKNGIINRIKSNLTKNKISIAEFPYAKEPSLSLLYEGIEIAKETKPNVVIGIGGGCCIDMAKSIAIGAANDIDIWDVLTKKIPWDDLNVLPIGAIVTSAGSGSEMDGNSEIDNLETGEHGSIGSFIKTYPTFTILDPELTYSCSFRLSAMNGLMTFIQAHEQYVCDTENTPLQDGFIETVQKVVLDSILKLKDNLEDENARGQLLWSGALTCNRILGRGKQAPWLAGGLGGLIDDTLGLTYKEGIIITWPKYLKICAKDNTRILKQWAINVMGVNPENKTDLEIAEEGADLFQQYIDDLGLPHTIKDLNRSGSLEDFRERINKLANRNIISKENIEEIVLESIG